MSRDEEQIENEFAAASPESIADGDTMAAETDDADDVQSLAAPDDELDDDEETDDEEDEVVIYDADAEDAAEKLAVMRRELAEKDDGGSATDAEGEIAPGGSRSMAELISIIESLIFVSEEPLPSKTLAEVLKEDRGWVEVAVEELAKEFNERNGGLMLREVAGGWQFATRPENHEHVRAFLKSRPSAKLSLAALETLAVIAYKQPITVPEILEIRGVQSSSAIKTLLDKRLIISKGRKETVGRPMMYGTSKEFLLQFGLRDLSELPNVEDFEDLATGGA
ncbi:MAG: segregation and condensation protein [Pyrinomonadaceae bacterium]|jgi:segregation and condensation protein B|nr:segregation and condensation protein [Pyrinomonadaceae bacterium]